MYMYVDDCSEESTDKGSNKSSNKEVKLVPTVRKIVAPMVTKGSFEIEISKFNQLPFSPDYRFVTSFEMDEYTWLVKVYPKGLRSVEESGSKDSSTYTDTCSLKDHVIVKLGLANICDFDKDGIEASYKLSCKAGTITLANSKADHALLSVNKYEFKPIKLFKYSAKKSYDSLTLTIDITVHERQVVEKTLSSKFSEFSSELKEKHIDNVPSSFQYSAWLKREELADFHMKYQERMYPVSKFILQSRSNILRVMLASTMMENTERVLELSDLTYPASDAPSTSSTGTASSTASPIRFHRSILAPVVIETFLCFLYINRMTMQQLKDHHLALLLLAHKYDISDLLALTTAYLISILSVQGFLTTAQLAEALQLEDVLKAVVEFAIQYLPQLTEHYKQETFFHGLSREMLGAITCATNGLSHDGTYLASMPTPSQTLKLKQEQVKSMTTTTSATKSTKTAKTTAAKMPNRHSTSSSSSSYVSPYRQQPQGKKKKKTSYQNSTISSTGKYRNATTTWPSASSSPSLHSSSSSSSSLH